MRDKSFKSFRDALTMLEVVLVIGILGIVASIGSTVIVQVYEKYIIQKALHNASTKAELAAMQISNRLTYRISDSAIGRKPGATAAYLPLGQISGDDTYTTLEWIGYDNDSFSAQSTPGWSGFCDVNDLVNTTRTSISTPGSNLGSTTAIIGKLSGSTKDIGDAAIIFSGHEYSPTKNYHATCMGYTAGDTSCISPINTGVDTSITVTDNNAKVMTDQYKLAWSAYAIVRETPDGDGIFDLTLHYNYQPWNGENYADGESSTLVEDVESFRFIGKGDTVRFKICIREEIGAGASENFIICKEKAVIR